MNNIGNIKTQSKYISLNGVEFALLKNYADILTEFDDWTNKFTFKKADEKFDFKKADKETKKMLESIVGENVLEKIAGDNSWLTMGFYVNVIQWLRNYALEGYNLYVQSEYE